MEVIITDKKSVDVISGLTKKPEATDGIYVGATYPLLNIHDPKRLGNHPGDIQCYKVIDEKGADLRITISISGCMAKLYLKTNASVIVTKNGPDVANGERGTVEKLADDHVIVRLSSGRSVKLERVPFSRQCGRSFHVRYQIPLKLAWGLTIHRCQGQTLPAVVIDLRKVYSHSMLGVALSRCQKQENIHILHLDIPALRSLEPPSPDHLNFIDTGDPPVVVRAN